MNEVSSQFLELYRVAPKIGELKPQDSEEYKVFSLKKGNPVALFSPQKHLEKLPLYESFYSFFQRNKAIWLIPIEVPSGKIVGFVLRSFHESDYRVYGFQTKVPMVYGLRDFGAFKVGASIVLTEGVKDVEVIKTVYPYVVGMLSGSMPMVVSEFIGKLAGRVILAQDNDSGGDIGAEADARRMFASRVQFVRMAPPVPGMDWATAYLRNQGFEMLRDYLIKL